MIIRIVDDKKLGHDQSRLPVLRSLRVRLNASQLCDFEIAS